MEQRANPELVDGKQESSRSSPLRRCATVELPPAYVRLLHRRDMTNSLFRSDIKMTKQVDLDVVMELLNLNMPMSIA
jgi:hypothetical protein